MGGVGDSRLAPQYPTATISISAFVMTSCQMGSLNEWEQSTVFASWKKYLHLEEIPGADTMANVASKMEVDLSSTQTE